jgi:hypothetical protein
MAGRGGGGVTACSGARAVARRIWHCTVTLRVVPWHCTVSAGSWYIERPQRLANRRVSGNQAGPVSSADARIAWAKVGLGTPDLYDTSSGKDSTKLLSGGRASKVQGHLRGNWTCTQGHSAGQRGVSLNLWRMQIQVEVGLWLRPTYCMPLPTPEAHHFQEGTSPSSSKSSSLEGPPSAVKQERGKQAHRRKLHACRCVCVGRCGWVGAWVCDAEPTFTNSDSCCYDT